MDKDITGNSLCFRCNHRALWWETGGRHQPRMECGSFENTKYTCYMYIPVQPVEIVRSKAYTKDARPLSPGYFSTRFNASGLADLELIKIGDEKKVIIYWGPKQPEDKEKGNGTDA